MDSCSKAESVANPQPRVGAVCVFFTGTLLGFVPVFKQLLNEQSLSSEAVVLVRLLLALILSSLIIVADVLVQKRKHRKCNFWPDKDHIYQFLGYGAISIAAVNFLYIKSLDYVSAPVAVFSIFATEPVVTFIAAILLKRNSATAREVILIGIILFGCVLVNFEGVRSDKEILGVLLALAGGACYGLFSIFGENLTDKYDTNCMLFWQYTIATIATVITYTCLAQYRFVFGELVDMVIEWNNKTMYGALGIGIFSTFIPYWLYSCGLRKGVKNTTAGALTLMEPVVTTILVCAFFGQVLIIQQEIGVLLVLGASIVLAFVKQR